MIQERTVHVALEEALTKLCAAHADVGITYKIISSKKQDGPYAAFLNHPQPHMIKSCFLHNISRGLLAITGDGLYQILEACYRSWIDSKIEKINVCNTVLDARFRSLLKGSGADFDKSSMRFLLDRAKRLANGNRPEDVVAVDSALRLFTAESFDDQSSIDYLFERIDTFRNVTAMIRRLSQHSYLAADTEKKYTLHFLVGSKSENAEARAEIAEKLGVVPDAIKMLCTIVTNHGTVNFIKKYAEYLEEDRQRLKTLADEDAIASLVSEMNCS